MPEAWASAWTCSLPSALPVMETSPEVLVSSRRVGPLTLSVRSKLPLTDGPIVQPAPAKAANSKPGRAAKLRCLIIPPCEFRAKGARLQPQSKACLRKIRGCTELCSERGMRSRAFLLRQCFVQRALAIAFEVQRDVGEAHALQGLRNRGAGFLRERAVHLFGRDFDARQLVVQSHAELPEAEFAKSRFAAFDQREALGSDFGAVGHAGGETRRGGAVPRGQAGALRELTNFRFAQAGIEQRGQHAMFFGGAMTGAKIERVVGIDAISRCGETALLRNCIEHGEELILAVKAAVGGVRAVCGILYLVRFDEFVMDLKGANEFVDGGAVMRRKAGRECGDRKSAVAERTLRGPRQVSGIGAAGERDDQGTGVGKAREKRRFFLFR